MFWSRSRADYGDAWSRYMRFTREGGKKTFVELCRHADITVPFDDGALSDICGTAANWLK